MSELHNKDKGNDMESSILEYNIHKLLEKVDNLQTTVNTINTDVNVLNTKVDDFSFRLKKLEERDEKVQQLVQKLELMIEKLEPDVEQLQKDHIILEHSHRSEVAELDRRLIKLENNWGWVCCLTGVVGGAVVWLLQFFISKIFG